MGAGDDPIFAAIRHERAMKAAYDAASTCEDQLEGSRPAGTYLDDEEGAVFIGIHQGKGGDWRPLLARNMEHLYNAATVVAVDRGLPMEGTLAEKTKHYGWQAWGDEVKQWDAKLKEFVVRREASRRWREETGYDAALQACSDACDRHREAQKALLETQPTTVNGLLAYLDWLGANASCDVIDEHGEPAFATPAASVRKLLTPA